MPEVALGRDLEVEVVTAPDPLRPLHHAREGLVPRLRRGERPEVVLTRERNCSRAERVLVERARNPPAAPHFERRGRRAGEEPIAVAARVGAVASVEVVGRGSGRENGDLVGQPRVERSGDPLRRRAALDVHRGDLAERMNTRVGAAGHREVLDRSERPGERLPQRRLDRGQPGLSRPAVERRTVVLERQDEPHVRAS